MVDYLLSQCSADPLAKDEMGCVASDLTMDKDILETLTRCTNEVTAKRELERLAATLPQHSKRNTYCFDLIEHESSSSSTSTSQTTSSQLTRAQSMFINPTEAEYIREQFNKTKNQTIGGFQPPSTDEYSPVDWNFTRQNSAPPTKTRTLKEDTTVSSTISQLVRRSSTKESGKSRLKESRNRDSGVFDEDTNEDSSSERSLKTRTQNNIPEEHYNLI